MASTAERIMFHQLAGVLRGRLGDVPIDLQRVDRHTAAGEAWHDFISALLTR